MMFFPSSTIRRHVVPATTRELVGVLCGAIWLSCCCSGVVTRQVSYSIPEHDGIQSAVTTEITVPYEHIATIERALQLAADVVFSKEFDDQMKTIWEKVLEEDKMCDPTKHDCADDARVVSSRPWNVELLREKLRNKITVDVKYAHLPSTVAWDGGESGPVLLACNRLNCRTVDQWAGTIVHEVSHRAGYTHTDNTSKCPSACCIPYLAGYLASRMAWEQTKSSQSSGSWTAGDVLCSTVADLIVPNGQP
ncbi:MAG: hypothetical protein HUU55_24210, partial [Myxococcales bacterium]|nr:hypothetical protein [Myxococcales bacterium]